MNFKASAVGLVPGRMSHSQESAADFEAVPYNEDDDKAVPTRRTSPRKTVSESAADFEAVPYNEDDDKAVPTRRTSPRKTNKSSWDMSPKMMNSSGAESLEEVKLLPNSNLTINRQALRKACQGASKKKEKAGFQLMYSLLENVFSIREMAESRGTGQGRATPGDEYKPCLDAAKITVLKEYVNSWCRKNLGCTFPEKDLNAAVTERNAYARKQLKKKTV